MESVTTERFRKAYSQLPESVKQKARLAYRLWKEEPFHPGLAFKQISVHQSIYSVRIGLSYRALGIKDGNSVVWFWIGSHEDYNTLIKQL